MFDLLIPSKEQVNITKEEFLADIDVLFSELKKSYSGYEYFKEDNFLNAKKLIMDKVNEKYLYTDAYTFTKSTLLSFIKDGHFSFGFEKTKTKKEYPYAFQRGSLFGLDYLDVKKFYYDTPEEKEQIDDFVFQAIELRKKDSFIIDLRDNRGGSDQYIYDFIELLFGVAPDYPMKVIQKYSDTFIAYLKRERLDTQFEIDKKIEEYESDGVMIKNNKKIYVLFNENTSSSGESALAYFKTIENVVFVGNHSRGCFSFGNCITIYLPHSKIPVYFGTGMVLYNKNQNIDALGGFKGDISYIEFEKHFTNQKKMI
ncbi:MAG: S41 family peptidase [Roseburia sp.]|nr:S41 family peptidase [Anaeroplasma bactoclasticum]MCM1195969.1 S41 family peptidase [Roseburia sp.]MCM1556419.1 S41 family peptidase [Anaeroplasma bactoclasticum]